MKDLYQIDMEQTQAPKLVSDIPLVDYLITMGCNVTCPILPFNYESEDWGITDPTGKSDEEFIEVIHLIEKKVLNFIDKEKEC